MLDLLGLPFLPAANARRRVLRTACGVLAASCAVALAAATAVVNWWPSLILYHEPGGHFRLEALLAVALTLPIVLLLPRLARPAALAAGGSLANLVSGYLWPGAPDYLYLGDRVINAADVLIGCGVVLTALTALVALTQGARACRDDWRRARRERGPRSPGLE